MKDYDNENWGRYSWYQSARYRMRINLEELYQKQDWIGIICMHGYVMYVCENVV